MWPVCQGADVRILLCPFDHSAIQIILLLFGSGGVLGSVYKINDTRPFRTIPVRIKYPKNFSATLYVNAKAMDQTIFSHDVQHIFQVICNFFSISPHVLCLKCNSQEFTIVYELIHIHSQTEYTLVTLLKYIENEYISKYTCHIKD